MAVAETVVDYTRNREMILEYLGGNESLLDTIVRANTGLVRTIARKYVNYGIALEDLMQEGFIGLIKAVNKYRPDRDVKNHLTSWIRQTIQRHCDENCGSIRVTKKPSERKLFYRRGLITQYNDSIDGDEREEILTRLMNETGLTEDEVLDASANLSFSFVSLDKEINRGGKDGTLHDILGNEEEETVEDAYIRQDARAKLLAVIDQMGLTERERYILEKRYLDEDPQTLEELGETFHLSRERIRQIETGILDRLKKRLARVAGEFFPDVDVFVSALF